MTFLSALYILDYTLTELQRIFPQVVSTYLHFFVLNGINVALLVDELIAVHILVWEFVA